MNTGLRSIFWSSILSTLLLFGMSCAGSKAPATEDTDAIEDSSFVDQGTADGTLSDAPSTDQGTTPLPSGLLGEVCEEVAPEPFVEEVAPNLFVARGYDLANTILLKTPDGNVVIDVSTSPERATVVKEALMAVASGPTRVIIYTHSHADHIGGASVWVEDDTEIWATDAFFPHLLKQYGAFRGAEVRRAQLQHGQELSHDHLPCSSIGPRIDINEALSTGVRKPTHTFSGATTLEVGGVTIELVEAHGETHDQLFVWIPSLDTLMPGDNYYSAFPNLYTIRGTTARPINDWIDSLDKMRALDPDKLVPSHTAPIIGRDNVRDVLRNYRDAIQWLRDEVARGANQMTDLGTLTAQIALPDHLGAQDYLRPLYGQIDWSVRAIYSNDLGWFDGRADKLYPPDNIHQREVDMMGGPDSVLTSAVEAAGAGEHRWAIHLLAKLRDSGSVEANTLAPHFITSYRALGLSINNTNGRAYLLQTAQNMEQGPGEIPAQQLDDAFLDTLPIESFFDVMPARLKAEETMDIHETLKFEFTDVDLTVFLTIRYGICELTYGDALPGTPEPSATVTTDRATWRRLSLGLIDPVGAVSSGSFAADDLIKVLSFTNYFDQNI